MPINLSNDRPLPTPPRLPFDKASRSARTKEIARNHSTPSHALRSLWNGFLDTTRREVTTFQGGMMGNTEQVEVEGLGEKRKRKEKGSESTFERKLDARDDGERRKRRKDENHHGDFESATAYYAPPRTTSASRSKKPRIVTAPQYTLSAPRGRRRTTSDAEITVEAPPQHLRFDGTIPRLLPPTSKFTFRVDPSLDSFPIPPAQLPPQHDTLFSQTPLRPTCQRRAILRETITDNLPKQRENIDFVQDVFFDKGSGAFNAANDGMRAGERKELDKKRIADLEEQVKALKRELSSRPRIPLRSSPRNSTKSPGTICTSINAAIRSTPKKSSNLATTFASPKPYSTSLPASPCTLHQPDEGVMVDTVYGEAISTDETIRLPLPPGSISPFVPPALSRIPLRPLVLSAKASRVYAPLPSRRNVQKGTIDGMTRAGVGTKE